MLDLDKLRNSQGKIWLNVASSTYVLDDFINLDNHLFLNFVGIYPVLEKIVPAKYKKLFEEYVRARNDAVLIRHDCRSALPVADKSVDHILCSHFLEHVHLDEAKVILRDFGRVLKEGGTMHIVVPDLKQLVDRYLRQYDEKLAGAAQQFLLDTLLVRQNAGSFKYRLLDFYGSFGMQHKFMYDALSLQSILAEAGFRVAELDHTPSRDYRRDDGSLHVAACLDKARP